jgi:AAA domain
MNDTNGNGAKFDWSACVQALTDEHLAELAAWRGYSPEFCNWLRDNHLIGRYRCGWAFPVGDTEGNVIGAHYLHGDPAKKDWRYSPGATAEPFVIGDIQWAVATHCFESRWDAFAFLDISGDYLNEAVAVVITRGAANTSKIVDYSHSETELLIWPQNDSAGLNGEAPSEKWFKKIQSSLTRDFYRVSIPRQHKDLNNWVRSGATKEAILQSIECAALFAASGEGSPKPLRPMPSWIDYGNRQIDRSKYHVGEGFLEVGGFVMLIGPSYAGKSTLVAQLSIYLSIGRSWLFFKVQRPLKFLVVQAEDPENKLTRMGYMFKRKGLTDEQIKTAMRNTAILTIRDLQDAAAIRDIERHAQVIQPDVLIINPMTSYLSGSVYKDEVINKFLRVELTPMLDRLQMSAIVVHHPPKPVLNSKEPKDLTAFELQYGGAGMAALTNAPRGNMFLVHVDGDVFKLSVGKGFEDLGTKETSVFLRRSKDKDGIMLWEQCDREQAEQAAEKQENRKQTTRQTVFVPYDRILKVLKPTQKYSPDKIVELAKKELNMGRDRAKTAMRLLAAEKKLAKSEEKNPKGQPFVFYHLPTILEPAGENGEHEEDFQ